MLKTNNGFTKFIRNILIIFVSREFAFVYCVMGTIAQVAHTYYLTSSISSLSGGNKVFQATILSAFLSTSLLFFTSISDNKHTTKSTNVKLAVNLFMTIEILINLYYYSRHLIIENLTMATNKSNFLEIVGLSNSFDFIFAILISTLIPVTLKLYSTHIRAHEWIAEVEELTKKENENKELPMNLDKMKEQILSEILKEKEEKSNSLEKEINEKLNSVDDLVKKSFEKNSNLFIKQFENKVKTLESQIKK